MFTMRKFYEAVVSSALTVMVAPAVAMAMGVFFSSTASAQDAADQMDFGPWFVSAPIATTADQDEVEAAAMMAVNNCPKRMVICVGSASGDRESSVRNTEYATARKEQCVAAVRKSGGSPMSLSFLATGTGSENGRGIMMFCAGGTQGPPGQSASLESRDATVKECPNGGMVLTLVNGNTRQEQKPICNGADGPRGYSGETRSAKDRIRLGFRTGMGGESLPGILGRQGWGNFNAGLVVYLPELAPHFGLEVSAAYGDLFRGRGNFLHQWEFRGGMVIGPFRWFDLFLGYRFNTGMTPDEGATHLREHQGTLRFDFWLHKLVQLNVYLDGGYAIHVGQSTRVENRADGSSWQVDTTTRFTGWSVGVGLWLTVFGW